MNNLELEELAYKILKGLKSTEHKDWTENLDKVFSDIRSASLEKHFAFSKKKEKEARNKRHIRLQELFRLTKYEEPTYPSMGEAAIDGSCYFESEEIAKELLYLIPSSWEYDHVLKWEGAGKYVIEPSYGYRNGDHAFTATFKKA